MDDQSRENEGTANGVNLLLLVSSIETNEAGTKRREGGAIAVVLPGYCCLLTSWKAGRSGRGSNLRGKKDEQMYGSE